MVNLTATFCADRVTIKNWQNACGAVCLFMFGHSDIYMGEGTESYLDTEASISNENWVSRSV